MGETRVDLQHLLEDLRDGRTPMKARVKPASIAIGTRCAIVPLTAAPPSTDMNSRRLIPP